MASTIRGSDNFDSGGGNACKAWVNFNGTVATPSIRASYNVGSVTKNATSDYTVNFTAALTDANFCATFSKGESAATAGYGSRDLWVKAYATNSVRIVGSATAQDFEFFNLSVFR